MTKITMAAARKNAKLTQQALADKMGVSRQTVRLWENGQRKMKTAYLFMFCSIVGMKEEDIILPR